MDLWIWLLAALSLFVGCWIQTALGFGMAVIAAPIIVILNPLWVPVALTLCALFLSVLNTWNQREYIEYRALALPFITRIPGTILGAWLLLQLDIFALQLFVAGCVFAAVIISYYGKQFDYTPRRMGLAAFISGIMGTTTSIGGPPMALVMQHGKPQNIRANLSIYFGYSCTISMISYAYIGVLNQQLLIESLSFLPVCLLGFVLGVKARPYIDDNNRFRPLLLSLCSIAALIAFIGALLYE
ncbi:hypothetical protein A3715_13190 [Oleiphilus sp. HI0009]|nr:MULTISPECIES: sulfite exporter TauE/SafE family protein [unclassified Oleiphilus]KZX74282.1 hypothetical protein A3715_23965 [Oleiphilus sp. HI0009]KZX76452.1 hypothetical protein A3715_13190 [Oleiphilus sp. HI0009]KZY63520.1 hypothetical protein A3738_11710 [Oleiphilus sp. HI0066]KZY74010.1 hypothetical protein A3739_14950 [Oleiphilus sp. HI0067]